MNRFDSENYNRIYLNRYSRWDAHKSKTADVDVSWGCDLAAPTFMLLLSCDKLSPTISMKTSLVVYSSYFNSFNPSAKA